MPASPPSALLVAVTEAEPLVRAHRLRLDPVAERGVPAHVTALYPFVERDDLSGAVLSRVAAVALAHRAFGYRFSTTGWFDRDVLFLAPDDPAPFASLTRALYSEFPDHPPYAGAHSDLMPHLTVAQQTSDADLDAVEEQLRTGLPVAGPAAELTLMTEDDEGRWTVLDRFPFGA
jgi:2'-5' RNA ligase